MVTKVTGALSLPGLSPGTGWDGCEQLGRCMARCSFLLLCFHLWTARGELEPTCPLIRRGREAGLILGGVREAVLALVHGQLPFCLCICCDSEEAFCALVALSLSPLEAKTPPAGPHHASIVSRAACFNC